MYCAYKVYISCYVHLICDSIILFIVKYVYLEYANAIT